MPKEEFKMRTLIKVYKSGDCLVFTTYRKSEENSDYRYKGKSTPYYLSLTNFYRAANLNETVIDQDIKHFAALRLFRKEDLLRIEFTFIHLPRCYQDTIYLHYRQFRRWVDSGAEDTYRQLSVEIYTPNRIIFTESGMEKVKEVLSNPFIKRKFIKVMRDRFIVNGGRTYIFHSDFTPYGFFWKESGGLNGGLILHLDYRDPDNYHKAKYGIHT